MISKARRKVELNAGVNRLSGGALKERTYTEGAACVQTKLPDSGPACVGGTVGIWRTNSGG